MPGIPLPPHEQLVAVVCGARSLQRAEVLHKVGDWIPEKIEHEILSLYDPENVQARVDVTQSHIGKVQVGGRVLIRTEADTKRQYNGTVLRAEPLADLAKNVILLGVQDHLELWAEARWQSYLADRQAHFDEIAEAAFDSAR